MFFFWLILYGAVYALSDAAAAVLNNSVWLSPLAMTFFICFLVSWVWLTGQRMAIGLTLPCPGKKELLFLLPLLLFPLYNLFLTRPVSMSFSSLLLMLCICMSEELLFHGYLLSILSRRLGCRSIVIVSLTFSLFHFSNLLSGWPLDYVALQFVSAFAVSLYFCMIRLRFRSIIPCILAHFLTNITAGDLLPVYSVRSFTIWFLCVILYLICSFLLYKNWRSIHEILY